MALLQCAQRSFLQHFRVRILHAQPRSGSLTQFDLDPGEGIQWPFVIETAQLLRELLRREGFDSWPKLTGGKGLHVMVPLEPELTHEAVHAYAKDLAGRIIATNRARYTTLAGPAQRVGKLFIDCLRNGRGCTAIGAWSPRAREGLPVAMPMTWKEIERGVGPVAFSLSVVSAGGGRRRSSR